MIKDGYTHSDLQEKILMAVIASRPNDTASEIMDRVENLLNQYLSRIQR